MDLETVDIKFNKYIIIATSSFGIILIAFIVTSLHKINLKNCQLVKTVIQEQVSNGIYLFFNIFFYANLEELIAHKRKYVISYIGYILLYFKLVTLILQLGLSLLYLQTMLVAYGINVFKWFGSMAVGIVSWTVPMILVTIYGGNCHYYFSQHRWYMISKKIVSWQNSSYENGDVQSCKNDYFIFNLHFQLAMYAFAVFVNSIVFIANICTYYRKIFGFAHVRNDKRGLFRVSAQIASNAALLAIQFSVTAFLLMNNFPKYASSKPLWFQYLTSTFFMILIILVNSVSVISWNPNSRWWLKMMIRNYKRSRKESHRKSVEMTVIA